MALAEELPLYKATLDYFIYSTRKIFLVEKEKKLVGMPRTIEEIKKFNSNYSLTEG